MVARILRDESYIGTLICHKSERNKINKTFRFTDPEEQFRHENYLPMIVTREIWEQAQALLAERKEKMSVRAPTGASSGTGDYSAAKIVAEPLSGSALS